MYSRLINSLKKHLTEATADLKLVAQSDGGDILVPPRIWTGDLPPKKKNGSVREIPCVVIVPFSGHMDSEQFSCAAIALICCVYNPEDGDSTGGETDLAALISKVSGALYPASQGVPLAGRYILGPDLSGRLLHWEKGDTQPRPFLQATITSHWSYKGWE
ncbi:hypothetical protein C4J81_16380 [Deltaproteobacteria bacterium Smac51]|nr:hypothetical protein C4J81_16380 [Deltaproteobacteria bacterium Smac51]